MYVGVGPAGGLWWAYLVPAVRASSLAECHAPPLGEGCARRSAGAAPRAARQGLARLARSWAALVRWAAALHALRRSWLGPAPGRLRAGSGSRLARARCRLRRAAARRALRRRQARLARSLPGPAGWVVPLHALRRGRAWLGRLRAAPLLRSAALHAPRCKRAWLARARCGPWWVAALRARRWERARLARPSSVLAGRAVARHALRLGRAWLARCRLGMWQAAALRAHRWKRARLARSASEITRAAARHALRLGRAWLARCRLGMWLAAALRARHGRRARLARTWQGPAGVSLSEPGHVTAGLVSGPGGAVGRAARPSGPAPLPPPMPWRRGSPPAASSADRPCTPP